MVDLDTVIAPTPHDDFNRKRSDEELIEMYVSRKLGGKETWQMEREINRRSGLLARCVAALASRRGGSPEERTSEYRWDIFISHAHEDKKSVAVPLSDSLARRSLLVWLDNQELVISDSLRRKIDEGLANSRYGAVVLSADFFRKEWPQKELDAFISRERNGARVVIPIWHGVAFADVARYSPILADRLAADTSTGIEKVASDIARVIERDRSIAADAERLRALSRTELATLTTKSVDPKPWGPVRREGMNAHLSDAALRGLILSRNAERKPTYLLRQEYERRLDEREL